MNSSDNFQDSALSRLMPLMNSSFTPGQAQATVDNFQDLEQRQIAQAELYYFSGRAEECRNIAELYLQDKDLCLRLSAALLYSFSNLTLGNPSASRMGFRNIQECLLLAKDSSAPKGIMASCVFANYLAMVLMHLPTDGLPPLQDFLPSLPSGLRAYAVYVLAHNAYLHKKYKRALGLCQSVFLMLDGCYPVAMEYLYCVIIMCLINLKQQDEARKALIKAWNMAKPDGFLEPFIEHHGLMLGQIEACIKPAEPESYRQLSQAVIAFSRGWMAIHNPQLQSSVTDKLTPMEYSIAMLASKGWTNQEIAKQLSLSPNTIKHYLSRIFHLLDIEKREELKPFVNK